MLLVFVAELPVMHARTAGQLLQQFSQFNASIHARKEGGVYLAVPSHKQPLRTSRALTAFCRDRYPTWVWMLRGLDDAGRPTIPITEEGEAHDGEV